MRLYPEDVQVFVDGVRAEGFRSVVVEEERPLHEVRALGAGVVGGVPQPPRYRLVFEQLCLSLFGGPLRPKRGFTVTLRGKSGAAAFSGCEWVRLEGRFGEAPGLVERAECTARSREEEQG